MSTSIALLSGKGGSGKTSLALTMASLLSECEIRTLMIDCDMATNGATYFFESMLSENEGSLDSIDSILKECISPTGAKGITSLNIKDYFSFFPSITKVKDTKIDYSILTEDEAGVFQNVMKRIHEKFDVLIYDFQAGYSELMKLLLPMVDVVLFVVEPDAVSASSLRSLYLKIGDILESKKTYQIFNKASEEEYKVYSKLYSGTLFPMIDTIRFDWEIRKAFSLANIPSIDNCSYAYLKQVIELSVQLIPDTEVQRQLTKYRDEIELNRIEKRNDEIRGLLNKRFDRSRKNSSGSQQKIVFWQLLRQSLSGLTDIPFFLLLLMFGAGMLIGVLTETPPSNSQNDLIFVGLAVCLTAIFLGLMIKLATSSTLSIEYRLEQNLLRNELNSLEEEKQKLLKKMEEADKKIWQQDQSW